LAKKRVKMAEAKNQPGPVGIVRLANVHKRFGAQVVLDGVNLAFEEGKTTVVMGPSGCGKSVMLKHIVGLLRPDSGEIHFAGQRIDQLDEDELAPVRLQIGLVFQMGALFDSMSVEDNIAFPLIEHTPLSARERKDRIAEALDTVDLQGVQVKLPSQLSGGQRKRVAIARALVMRPRVILFDEPTTGLDPIRSAGIDDLIIRLRDRFNVTNIVVTHDLASAKHVADRVIMLLGGKVAADGSFDSLSHSSDQRIQHFLTGTYSADDEPVMPETDKSTQDLQLDAANPRLFKRGGKLRPSVTAPPAPGGRTSDMGASPSGQVASNQGKTTT
jgi:phospholipid/cholesterol/gamma-HCH transport system ATP-binding protein